MRMKIIFTLIVLQLLLLAMPVSLAMQMAQADVPKDWAYIEGWVTVNGKYQDGVSVSIPGGNSDTTKNGGYYKVFAYPNIGVMVKASYQGASQSRGVEVGGEGSMTTYNFTLETAGQPTVEPTLTPTPAPKTIMMVGIVKYDNEPMNSVFVTVGGERVKTDSAGQYLIAVPAGENITVSVGNAGTVFFTRNVVSPADGTSFVTDLAYTSPAPSVTVTPAPIVTNTPSPTASAAQSGSQSLAILSIAGLVTIVGLLRLKKT